MLIDWFTLGAQALNFLVLVWLLKRFLYRPILDAVDAREKRIASELADAAAKQVEAGKERDAFNRKNEEFDRQRADLFRKATEEVKGERQRLLDAARKEADVLAAKRQEALKNATENLTQELRRRTQDEIFAIARKTLSDLAGASLEERLIETFTRRLRDLDAKTKSEVSLALKSTQGSAVFSSAFDLSEEQRAALQQALNVAFSDAIPIRFETVPKLIAGVEFSTNGRKFVWSISDYLSSMEAGVGEWLKEAAENRSIPNAP